MCLRVVVLELTSCMCCLGVGAKMRLVRRLRRHPPLLTARLGPAVCHADSRSRRRHYAGEMGMYEATMSSQFVPFADYPSVSDKHGTGTVTATDILATAATSGFQLLIRGSALVFCRPKRPAGWIKIARGSWGLQLRSRRCATPLAGPADRPGQLVAPNRWNVGRSGTCRLPMEPGRTIFVRR